jgi:hypothetical protein
MRLYRQFDQMRGDHQRTWHRRSDILDRLRSMGCGWAWYEVSFAFAGLPRPLKKYGHYRYTQRHMDAAISAWCKASGMEVVA